MNSTELFRHLPLVFCGVLVAILFVQSGLDKVFDWKGNLEWLSGHFSKTFLARGVPPMLVTITVMEVATGVASALGVLYLLATGVSTILFYSSIVGAATLTALFFGQRVAKDYPGAAVIVPYFLLVIVMMYLSRPV